MASRVLTVDSSHQMSLKPGCGTSGAAGLTDNMSSTTGQNVENMASRGTLLPALVLQASNAAEAA